MAHSYEIASDWIASDSPIFEEFFESKVWLFWRLGRSSPWYWIIWISNIPSILKNLQVIKSCRLSKGARRIEFDFQVFTFNCLSKRQACRSANQFPVFCRLQSATEKAYRSIGSNSFFLIDCVPDSDPVNRCKRSRLIYRVRNKLQSKLQSRLGASVRKNLHWKAFMVNIVQPMHRGGGSRRWVARHCLVDSLQTPFSGRLKSLIARHIVILWYG